MLLLTPNLLLHTATPARRIGQAAVEADMRRLPHLAVDRRLRVRDIRRRCADARMTRTAAAAIATLPTADESLHVVISGRYALAHFVPAILNLAGAGAIADETWIATLGFSRRNVDDWCALLDAGRVRRFWLLCSHYFKSTSTATYDYAAAELAKRPGARFLSLRTHAKLILICLADGRTFAIESSANARSCKNIENATIIGAPDVFAFHRGWMADLFTAPRGQRV